MNSICEMATRGTLLNPFAKSYRTVNYTFAKYVM